jgi:hypothetical protein
MRIEKYSFSDARIWDDVVLKSKNHTFYFFRSYLDYHIDRFVDHSLIIYHKDIPVAVFPATERKTEIDSYEGLPFGGLLYVDNLKQVDILKLFCKIVKYYHDLGFEKISYKVIPSYYHYLLAQEDLYALFILKSCLLRRDTGFVIEMNNVSKMSSRKNRNLKKSVSLNLEIKLNDHYDSFWNEILHPLLNSKYDKHPVHSLDEIVKLSLNNPGRIEQHSVYLGGQIIAGTTIFINNNVVHSQYIAANELGHNTCALDFLFFHLINKVYKNCKYFSFGISNENEGRFLNVGLTEWKEGFGARTWVHDFYTINTANYILLDKY